MNPGNIVILNGTSSSGKTSIVRALQNLFDAPYLEMGIEPKLFFVYKSAVSKVVREKL
jgi:chloramphenicol 3-O-phosphotransferase